MPTRHGSHLLGQIAEDRVTTVGRSLEDDPAEDPAISDEPSFRSAPDVPTEAKAIDLLTDELARSADILLADAECVSQVIVGEIGVEGLARIGLATGGTGDFADMTIEEQDRILAVITDAFGACDVSPN